MKSVFKFLIFLLLTVSIFIIDNYVYLVGFAIFSFSLIFMLKINLKKLIKAILKMCTIIIITVVFNILLGDVITAIEIGVKLLLVYISTYIFSKSFSYMELVKAIEIIFYPFKVFGINSKDIGLIVCIGMTFLPILSNEINQVKSTLIVKGFDMRFMNVIKNLNLILKPFFISVLSRVNEIEISLKSKAYQE